MRMAMVTQRGSAIRLSLLALFAACATYADPTLRVEFTVNVAPKDHRTFVVSAHRDWAPLGFDRFKELVEIDFFGGCRFFRNIEGFMAQFGISGKPEIAAEWKDKKILDDPVVKSNKRGFISFATSGKDSRTTQMFINHGDNSNLDGMGFSPFAEIEEDGMEVVKALFAGYGEGGRGDGTDGAGPNQGRIQDEGNKYLKKVFPKLSYITKTTILGPKDDL